MIKAVLTKWSKTSNKIMQSVQVTVKELSSTQKKKNFLNSIWYP